MKHNYNIFTKQELAGFLRDHEKDFFYTVSPFDILIERKMDNVMKEIRKNIECGGLLLDKFNQTKDIEDFKPIMDRNDEYSKLMKEYDRLEKLRFPKEVAYAERVWLKIDEAEKIKEFVLSEQKEPCKGCQHDGEYENEVEYGYPSPCTQCKRRCSDNYLNQPYME